MVCIGTAVQATRQRAATRPGGTSALWPYCGKLLREYWEALDDEEAVFIEVGSQHAGAELAGG